MNEELFTIADIAKYFKMSEAFFYARTKVIPHYKIGGRFRFKLSDVLRYFDDRDKRPTTLT